MGESFPNETQVMKQFPIQGSHLLPREQATVPEDVYMAAYEVYCHVYSPQEALITGHCRGGFGIGELVAFLYTNALCRIHLGEFRTSSLVAGSPLRMLFSLVTSSGGETV